MTTEPSPAFAALNDVKAKGRAFARAQARRDAARDALTAAIRAADAIDGVTRTAIIETSGVAKQTVYDALKATPAATPEPPPLSRPLGDDLLAPAP